MNSVLNVSEDLENEITSNLAIIANESKTILMAIEGIIEKIKNSEESKRNENLEKSFTDLKQDFVDNFERIDNAEKGLPQTSPEKFQWAIAEIKDPIKEALKLFNNHPSIAISTKWFDELADKLKSVHSIAGRVFVLETFNEVVIKNRKPGWSIKLHEFLQRYLLYPEDRKKVIEDINSREDINAYVDDRNDILYIIAGGYGKWRGVGLLLLTFLLGLVPIFLIGINKIPTIVSTVKSFEDLMLFYIICWAGFVLHIITKSTDVHKENSCLDDIVHWIRIKETGFLMSAVAVFAGYLVLLGMGTGIDRLNFASAIASGFAVDSFGSRIIKHYYSQLENAAKGLEEIKLESH